MTHAFMLSSLLCALAFSIPAIVWARGVSPFVSTNWLRQNLDNPNVVIVDTRKAEEYEDGHIPGAVSAFFGAWIVERNGLLLELPAEDDLMELIGSLGIRPDTTVVVVSMADDDHSRADATRVAWTMMVAGLRDIAVLEGGYAKWLKENGPISAATTVPEAIAYKGRIDKSILATKEYVMSKIGKSVILDNRDANVYFGAVAEPSGPRAGHIKGAVSLPTPWIYDKEGVPLPKENLEAMAVGVIGKDKSKEVIVYCGVGGYASTWWFVLTRMLGYENVLLYDGSAQEWVADPEAPMTRYGWQ